jgi:hypothetical protein
MEVFAMEEADGLLRFVVRGHGDEGEATGLAGHFVLHESAVGDGTSLSEELLEVVFNGVEGKIPDVEFIGHD